MPTPERRISRSTNTTEALCHQLRASLGPSELSGMVLVDNEGFCLASAGDDVDDEEIAAQLPLLGRKVDQFQGVLYGPESQWQIHMQRFDVDDSELYLCAIGQDPSRSHLIDHSLGGVRRILAPVH